MNRSNRIRPRWTLTWVLVVCSMACWSPREAAAEGALEEEAQVLLDAGRLAFEDGRIADARDLFQRSLELVPRSGTAWNLALALRATNELIQASQILRGLLEGRYGPLEEGERAETEALAEEISRRVGTLRISTGASVAVDVTIDGEPAGVIEPEGVLERVVVAGQHVVRGVAEGSEPDEQNTTVMGGEVSDVRFDFDTSDVGGADVGGADVGEERTRRRSLAREPWFWVVVIGTAALAATTGVLVWWFVDGRETQGLEIDPVFGSTEALRWSGRP